jgi:hypothetical protein
MQQLVMRKAERRLTRTPMNTLETPPPSAWPFRCPAAAAQAGQAGPTRGIEAALARFVNNCFALQGRQLRDDLPARLPAHQDTSAWAFGADAGANLL